jgi:hypothetical protein
MCLLGAHLQILLYRNKNEMGQVKLNFHIGGLAPHQTGFSFFLQFFWQKKKAHEKWREPFERGKG